MAELDQTTPETTPHEAAGAPQAAREVAKATQRRVALSAHRVSLEGLEDGWTDECYALITYASYDELQALQGLDEEEIKKQADLTWVDFMRDVVLKHFVGGKIMLLDDSGKPYVGDMLAEDVTATVDILAFLFKAVAGQGQLSPKVTAQEAPDATKPTAA